MFHIQFFFAGRFRMMSSFISLTFPTEKNSLNTTLVSTQASHVQKHSFISLHKYVKLSLLTCVWLLITRIFLLNDKPAKTWFTRAVSECQSIFVIFNIHIKIVTRPEYRLTGSKMQWMERRTRMMMMQIEC